MSTIFNPKHRGLYSAPSPSPEGERKTARSFRGSGWGVGEWSQKSPSATPWINTLVSQASQVVEKCFRSKRPNFASKNAFSPSAALRAAACKARVALGRVRQEKTRKIVTGLEPERHTRLKPSRKNFLRNSFPCSRPFGRAGWRSVHVQQGKRQNKSPEAVASGLCFVFALTSLNLYFI